MDRAGVWAPQIPTQARLGKAADRALDPGIRIPGSGCTCQEEEGLQSIKSNPPNWEPSCYHNQGLDGTRTLRILSKLSPCSARTLLVPLQEVSIQFKSTEAPQAFSQCQVPLNIFRKQRLTVKVFPKGTRMASRVGGEQAFCHLRSVF